MKLVDQGIRDIAATAAAGAQDGPPRVLLIDDDAIVRMLTASGLAERGWQVIEAESGARGLEIFDQERPQIVAVDAVMPGLDGFATCERLRCAPGGAHVPVVMLTGLDDETSIVRAYDAGATDFFVKTPGRWTLLSQRLRYLLRSASVREQLHRSRADLLKIQRIARLGSWRWDTAARSVNMSDQAWSLLGLPPQAGGVAQELIWQRVAARDRVRIERVFRTAGPGHTTLDFECRMRAKDSQIRIMRIEAELEFDTGGAVVAAHGAVQDVTPDRLAADQIRQLAHFDVLTGLPNRRHFQELFAVELERAGHRGAHLALLLIGVNRFRQINDSLGTRVGDQLLQEISRRLQGALRREDRGGHAKGGEDNHAEGAWPHAPARARLARYGGDEFAVLLPELCSESDIVRVGSRLLEVFTQPLKADGQELFMTGSVGAAVFPVDGQDVDVLLSRVDLAMREVEELGGNGVLRYAERMNTTRNAHWQLESALHRAIGLNQLELAYQPKIDVATGMVVGAEALMRWQRDGTTVPPSEFIPAAEDSGLIVPLTEWALAEACRQLDAWARAGLRKVPLSVNISGHHLQRGDLIAPVKRALLASGVDAAQLELELTETAMMRNLDVVLPQLEALKALGVALSIDDFGTGYSSLAYLKRLPIDTLKIDRSFVGELESSRDSAALVGAILAMGRGLRLSVVAEGVETQAQMRHLARLGCRQMQGFLFSTPVRAPAFADLLRRGPQDAWRAGPGRHDAPGYSDVEGAPQ